MATTGQSSGFSGSIPRGSNSESRSSAVATARLRSGLLSRALSTEAFNPAVVDTDRSVNVPALGDSYLLELHNLLKGCPDQTGRSPPCPSPPLRAGAANPLVSDVHWKTSAPDAARLSLRTLRELEGASSGAPFMNCDMNILASPDCLPNVLASSVLYEEETRPSSQASLGSNRGRCSPAAGWTTHRSPTEQRVGNV